MATAMAMAITAYGGPDVLQPVERPAPQPAAGEVVVRVRAAAVQPWEVKLRAGVHASWKHLDLPHVPGSDVAGVVDAVGPDVDAWAAGDEVLGFVNDGGYAELVVVPAGQLVRRPPTMPWPVAATLPGSAQTALTALRALGVTAGDVLLVHAAAGGVGTFAVQIARAWGATVVGTASPGNHEHLRAMGVVPVAYGDGLVDRVRAAAPAGVTVALDCVGGGEPVRTSLALGVPRDRIGTIADFTAEERYGVRQVSGARSAGMLRELVALWESGALDVPIHAAVPLRSAADAHREMETGHVRGKVVLLPDASDGGSDSGPRTGQAGS